MNGEPIAKICTLDTCITEMRWFPVVNNQRKGTAADLFVVACADGTFRIVNAVTGRVEKSVEAHKGAVVCLAWNWDGTALVTGGEEGIVKVWSQSGMLRATLANTNGQCVHSLAWAPQSDSVLITCGKELIVKPLQPSAKQLQWKAHEGNVLKVDWSPITNLIVSGGEDMKYKVWDAYGRLLFTSAVLDYPVTSVAFSPDGEMYAVGSFNMIRICDKTGWSQCREMTNTNGRQTGSIFNISWTSDCTQLACAGGSGAVCFGQLIDRRYEYRNLMITLNEGNKLTVNDVVADKFEDLEHRDKVIKVSVGYGYMVVGTSTQCAIYDLQIWNNPTTIFDVKDNINLICQAEKTFLIMDHFTGLQIFQYDGRPVCTLKLSGIRTEFLNYQCISLSPDSVAVKDTFDSKSIKIFEASSGKLNGNVNLQHHMEIVEVALNQFGPQAERKVAFIDRNRDLYIGSAAQKSPLHKLATMVASVKWNDYSEILVAIADNKLVVWYYPSVVFIDRDLLPRTRITRDDVDFDRSDQLIDFFGSRCTVRRGSDGAVLTFAVKPYPIMLFGHVGNNNWDAAVRLCRYVKEEALWAILAALAVKHGELSTAATAYGNINESDKLQYINYIMDIPTPEGRNAELALFQRRIDDAEQILVQAGLIYRAIKMHAKLFNWERALDLAVQHRTHIDTVLGLRRKYLESFHKEETSAKFLAPQIQQVEVNWDQINQKIEAEKRAEESRPNANRAE
eukprot:TRINITY_DN1232_c0_g1_i1.p2 TRINITY_DN1232_c0_g1~~TRINITY_DN1232_c0_g1_i1.p2  ORF type:complete len:816 (-),score=154.57 TRINITY_DN1232_c0_g1_i1:3038-5239(-)